MRLRSVVCRSVMAVDPGDRELEFDDCVVKDIYVKDFVGTYIYHVALLNQEDGSMKGRGDEVKKQRPCQ